MDTSVSGWALRHRLNTSPLWDTPRVSMPSVSGWALRLVGTVERNRSRFSFYALGFGLGFATLHAALVAEIETLSFYALGFGLGFATTSATSRIAAAGPCFYALGFGLGFATSS